MKMSKLAGSTMALASLGIWLGTAPGAHATLTYLGYEDPSLVPPSSTSIMQAMLNNAVSVYDAGGGTGSIVESGTTYNYVINNGSGSGLVSGTVLDNNSVGGGPSSYGITFSHYTGFLILAWDGTQGADQFYYLNNETGTDNFSNSGLPSSMQKGLSNYWLTSGSSSQGTSVPESSTIFAAALLLLPLGISTVRVFRKTNAA
jgi:hypothetical protein